MSNYRRPLFSANYKCAHYVIEYLIIEFLSNFMNFLNEIEHKFGRPMEKVQNFRSKFSVRVNSCMVETRLNHWLNAYFLFIVFIQKV